MSRIVRIGSLATFAFILAGLAVIASAVPPAAVASPGAGPGSTACLPEREGREFLRSYADPVPVRTYPSSPQTVQRWIDTLDDASMRAHGWDIWESITRPTIHGVPTWETWYSGNDVFNRGAGASRAIRDFEPPSQFVKSTHRSSVPSGERATAFNRYTRVLADYICANGLNQASTLTALNAGFDARNAPAVDRIAQTSAGTTESGSIALKPVFQFISGSGPTSLPYWAGVSVATSTNLANPEPHTWRQCVVVDPTGQLRPGSTAVYPCNAEPPAPRLVVGLDQLYAIRLTQADADEFSDFGRTSGDDVGAGNQTDIDSVNAAVKAGNVALLMAMHVTTKEIANWTWQTFWWTPYERSAPYGGDKPRSLQRPWVHYDMGVAYAMVTPPLRADGDPVITFNPYLETNLAGTVAGPNDTKINWTGVNSNCMSCHAMATWKANPQAAVKGQSAGSSAGYRPDGLIQPTDPWFQGYTRLDFLWSLQRAR